MMALPPCPGDNYPPDLATLQKVEDSSGATHAVVPNMSDGAQRPQPVDGALCRRDSHIELVWYATTSTTVQSSRPSGWTSGRT